MKWISDHRTDLKPPISNKCIYSHGTYIVMVLGGGNRRTDFHINRSDELFYQIKGNMCLRILNKDRKIEEITIREGDLFMLDKNIPHSPQRGLGSIGLVVELRRTKGVEDTVVWFCERCLCKLYEETFFLENIEVQFKEIHDRYFAKPENRFCLKCHHWNACL